MMDKDRIFMLFLAMSGLDEQEAVPFRFLCDGAAQRLTARLKEDADITGNTERLCLAAAAMAYGDWLELGGTASSDSEIRVGDITLREGSNRTAPQTAGLRERFLAGVADLLEPPFVLAAMREDTP